MLTCAGTSARGVGYGHINLRSHIFFSDLDDNGANADWNAYPVQVAFERQLVGTVVQQLALTQNLAIFPGNTCCYVLTRRNKSKTKPANATIHAISAAYRKIGGRKPRKFNANAVIISWVLAAYMPSGKTAHQ